DLYAAWRHDIEPGIAQAGIRRLVAGDLSPEQRAHLSAYFAREVWPVLTPLAVDPGHPFPMLRNRSLNLAVFMHREKEKVGRREIAHATPVEVVVFLRQALRLESDDVYLFDGPLHLADFGPLGGRDELRPFRDEPFSPQIVPPLQEYDDIFSVIAQRDILLQHPYESFEDVVEFISEAADDPNVLAIKQTLYRTSA